MSLTLKIILFNGQPYALGEDVAFEPQGGTIGRSDASTLTLEDDNKLISRRHAAIELKNGKYKLTDFSLAGTFVDDASEPLTDNESVQLNDGTKIRIGDYTIECQLSEQENVPPSPSNVNQDDLVITPTNKGNPFADDGIDDQLKNNDLLDIVENDFKSPFLGEKKAAVGSPKSFDSAEIIKESSLLSTADNNVLLDQISSEQNEVPFTEDNQLLISNVDEGIDLDQGLAAENISSLNDSFVPANPVKNTLILEQDEIPEDFNFEDLFDLEAKASVQAPEIEEQVQPEKEINTVDHVNVETAQSITSPQATSRVPDIQLKKNESKQLVEAFFSGARIDSNQVSCDNVEDQLSRIGAMFRQFVESTVRVLRSRAEFKSLFRVSVTTIKIADNNPLKFAVTTDEALKQLVNDGQGGFKKSVESIDEGFNDLLNHQLAMQAGIQASLADVLKQFDPELIEQQYSEGLFLQKKAKCWEQYQKVYAQLSESVVDDFYGDAFAQAYEEQMKRLKN